MKINSKPRYNYADGRPIIVDLDDGSAALMADPPNGAIANLGSSASRRFADLQNAVAANVDRITRIIGTIVVCGRLSLPVLKQIHGNLFLHDDAHFYAPNLHEVMGGIDAELPTDAPAFTGLIRITGDLQLKGNADAFPKLEQIGSSLIICDDYLDTGPVQLPKLIDVGGRLSANFPIDLLDQRIGPIAVAPRLHLLRTVYGNDLPGLVVHPAFDNPEGVDSQQQREWFDVAFARWKMHYDALDGLAPSTADALHLETDDTPSTGIAL